MTSPILCFEIVELLRMLLISLGFNDFSLYKDVLKCLNSIIDYFQI